MQTTDARSGSPAESSSQRALAGAILGGALAIGTALRLWLAFTDDGIYWPDEIYQSLEPAHRLVFGYGLVPWEFAEGARSWSFPALIALFLRLCASLGLDHPRQYLMVVRGLFALAGAATAYGCFKLARAYHASLVASATGAAAFCLLAPAIYFAPRAMSETASAVPVVFGLALLLRPTPGRNQALLGASLLGIAVLLRLQCGLFCVGALAVLLGRRQWRTAGLTLATLLVWAFLFGLIDHLTWADAPGALYGGWFHSAVKYLKFNLIEDGSKGWGVSPWQYYLKHLFLSAPGAFSLIALLCFAAARRASGLLILALAFVALHSWVGHKELRFILPVLPVLCALLGIGLGRFEENLRHWVAAPAVLLAAAWSALNFHSLTFGDVGQYPERAQVSAYDDYGTINRLLLVAHDQADLCGLRIDLAPLAWTGGSTYLHRKVPLYHLGQPPLESRAFNYVVTFASLAGSGEVIARDVRNPAVALVRAQKDGCIGQPGYPWRLP